MRAVGSDYHSSLVFSSWEALPTKVAAFTDHPTIVEADTGAGKPFHG